MMLRNIIRHLISICNKLCLILPVIFLCLTLAVPNAEAKKQTNKTARSGFDNSKYAALIIDASNGNVLYQKNAGKLRYPASLTKLMTLLLVFDALDRGQITMNTQMRVSGKAASQAPTKLGLKQGGRISVKDAIMGLILTSANDASVVIAENIAGSEARFADMMNQRARSIGMISTNFANASGLPNPTQQSTAYDFARLAMALQREHPNYYHLFSKKTYNYHGRTLLTHNRVLQNYRGADGLKTGYINASGYNLVTSATRNGKRLIGVVFGGASGKARDTHMIKLLDENFPKVETRFHASNAVSPIEASIPIPVLKPSSTLAQQATPDITDTLEQQLQLTASSYTTTPQLKSQHTSFQLSNNSFSKPVIHGNIPYPVLKPNRN